MFAPHAVCLHSGPSTCGDFCERFPFSRVTRFLVLVCCVPLDPPVLCLCHTFLSPSFGLGLTLSTFPYESCWPHVFVATESYIVMVTLGLCDEKCQQLC